MFVFSCFSAAGSKKKKNKENKPEEIADEYHEKLKTLPVRGERPAKSIGTEKPRLSSCKHSMDSMFNMKVMRHESSEGGVAYEKNLQKEDSSNFSFQSLLKSNEENYPWMVQTIESNNSLSNIFDGPFANKADRDEELDIGYESVPGVGKQEFWVSPKLVRSCSFVEAGDVLKNIAYKLPPSQDKPYEELHSLAEKMHMQVLYEGSQSPKSVLSHQSADRLMLKKHSTSQILPSRSRRLWWKLFLWSHRNMPKPLSAVSKTHSLPAALNGHGVYCSDNVEQNGGSELCILESPNSYTEPSIDGVSGFWQENQWVALSVQSPLPRVDDWIREVANQSILFTYDDEHDCIIDYPPSPEINQIPARNISLPNRRATPCVLEEVIHANSTIQSLNMSSTAAYITGVGLKVVPTLSQFSSLRSVNLSGNSISCITPGSLPKGLHTLDLSRNKISAIEGFRELIRLRVLDLSYNKISRIGQGLSSCTLIKELYLAGNKISEVEGLHRLLKLSVLDLSFNKICTTKSLDQLVANYNSLLALNLLGDPVQNNISDDQLSKAVCGIFPKVVFLNKLPVSSKGPGKGSLGKSASRDSRKKGLGSNSYGQLGSIRQSSRHSPRVRCLLK